MALSSQQILNQMIAQLQISDPDLSLAVGTPEWKILATVAEVIADAQSDTNTLQYVFDIDTKVGSDLDKFVALFGFARQGGTQSTGTVTFSTTLPAAVDTVIPAGSVISTQATNTSSAISFVTTASVVLFNGTTSVDAPIQCTVVGVAGNVAAGTITTIGNTAASIISSVTNTIATDGGTEIETDAALRVRFKNTVLRNVSGTTDQFLAIALDSPYTNSANVIGPLSRYTEYLQVPSSLTMSSQLPYSKYTYNFDYYLSQTSIGAAEILFQPGTDYSFNATVPPAITLLQQDQSRGLTVGSVLLLEQSYCSVNSRNYPPSGTTNYVDVYVDGVDQETATDSLVFPDQTKNFVTTSGSTYFTGNYIRANTHSALTAGNRFQSLLFQPVYSIPEGTDVIINGTTYSEGQDYWFVQDTTLTKGSKRAMNGLELGPNMTNAVTSGTTYTYSYIFNELPMTLNELMDDHKQITTDVLVHQATYRYFNINLVVIYSAGFSSTAVNAGITTALTTFFQKINFGTQIIFADILQQVLGVSGVANARMATAGDGISYGVQEYAPDGVTQIGQPYTQDFIINDCDVFVLNNVNVTQKSINSF